VPWWGLPVPDAVVLRATRVRPTALTARGIRALLVDLDNTLGRWDEPQPEPRVARWLHEVRAAGIRVCVVSNNRPERVRRFCEPLGDVAWVASAGKPRRRAYARALDALGVGPHEAAALGDQVFTDVLGGKRAGLFTILVRPLGRREFPLTRLARLAEALWLGWLRARGALRAL
jgi:HAD superfamily phosphatase (TIGR01668 family)